MKLGEYFLAPALVRQAPTRPVRFKAVGLDAGMNRIVVDVEAVLSFVDETARAEASRDANDSLLRSYKGNQVPAVARDDEEIYHQLARSLRDSSDPRQPFVIGGVEALRAALVTQTARDLWADYKAFIEEEFPERPLGADFDNLVEEAKKKSFSDLLSVFGFATIRRSLASLAVRLSTSATRT